MIFGSEPRRETPALLFRREPLEGYERFAMDASFQGTPLRLSLSALDAFGARGYRQAEASVPELQEGAWLEQVRIRQNTGEIGAYESACITSLRREQNGTEVTVRFVTESLPDLSHLISLPEKFRPQAHAAHPFRYDEGVVLTLTAVSRGVAEAEIPAAQRSLLAGAVLDPLMVYWPGAGMSQVRAHVEGVRESEHGLLKIRLRLEDPSRDFRDRMTSHLMAFAGASAGEIIPLLKAAGLSPKRIKPQLSFSRVTTEEVYQQVLQVRHRAYTASGKIPLSTPVSGLGDEDDERAFIFAARYRDEVVGTVRVVYRRHGNDPFELERHVKFPAFLAGTDAVLGNRLSVDPVFQGTDIVHGLIERCAEVLQKTQARWFICAAVEDLVPSYLQMGFKLVGKEFPLSTLNGLIHHLMVLDARSTRSGYRMDPMRWHRTYSKVAAWSHRFGFIPEKGPSWIKRAYIACHQR